MPLRVSLNILNQKGTPAFFSDIFTNRPAAGFAGRVFISTDTGAIYEDTGSAWTLIADAGAGTTGTLQQVTTNGNTTTQGISITGGQLTMGAQSIELGSSITNVSGNVRIQGDNTNNFTNETTGSKTDYGTQYIRITDKQNSNFTKYINFRSTGFTASYGILFPNADGNVALTDSAFTVGSIPFIGSNGVFNQKNSNFFWDNTNNRLGINTASPGASLDIHSTGTAAHFNGTGTNNAYVLFQNAGTNKWRIGNTYSAGANNLDIYNNTLAANALSFVGSTNAAIFSGNVGINTSSFSGFAAGTGIAINDASRSNLVLTDGTNVYNTFQTGVDAYTDLRTTGSMNWRNGSGNVIRYTLSAAGNFLIGTTTDNGSKLQVSGNISYSNSGCIQNLNDTVGASVTRTYTISGSLTGFIQIMVGVYANGTGSNSRALWFGGGNLSDTLPYTEVIRVNSGTAIISAISSNATTTTFTIQNTFAFNSALVSITLISGTNVSNPTITAS